jgi:hypothetical protein
MAIPENIGNMRFAIQAVKGTPEAASTYGMLLAGGDQVGARGTDNPFEESTGVRMRSDRHVSERHAEGAPEFYIPPKAIGALLYGVLGAKAVSGASDPYTHDFTPAASRPWFTFWRNTGALIYEQSSDCKIDQMVISGESGMPLRVAVTVQGLRPQHQTAEETTATLETTGRFIFYDGDGALQLESTAVADIRAFTLTISNNGELIPGDSLLPIDVSEGELTVSLAITKLALTADLRNRLYYGASSPSNDTEAVAAILELGATGVDFKFTRSLAPERSLQLAIPRVALAPFDIATGTGNTPLTEEIVLDALQPAGSDAITATLLNDVTAY